LNGIGVVNVTAAGEMPASLADGTSPATVITLLKVDKEVIVEINGAPLIGTVVATVTTTEDTVLGIVFPTTTVKGSPSFALVIADAGRGVPAATSNVDVTVPGRAAAGTPITRLITVTY
jgi:hypothetical protein